MYYDWKPYVSVAERRRKAAREMAKLRKNGHPVAPVLIEGRAIARTFWGKAWCDNLEGYSDYSNRLPRGRTYVRNGSVVDLQIAAGAVKAVVSGSELYKVEVKVSAVPKQRWSSICDDSAGAIDSLVELLQGRFSKGVMERLCQQRTGLFPSPSEIKLDCSCPDWASMCKHVAAVLYGIGARLDQQPELLFKLREVDEKDLIARAGAGLPLTKTGPAAEKLLDGGDLGEIFGLEMASDAPLGTRIQKPKAKRTSTKTPAKKTAKTATAAKSKAGNRHNASAPRAGTPSAAKRRSLAKK